MSSQTIVDSSLSHNFVNIFFSFCPYIYPVYILRAVNKLRSARWRGLEAGLALGLCFRERRVKCTTVKGRVYEGPLSTFCFYRFSPLCHLCEIIYREKCSRFLMMEKPLLRRESLSLYKKCSSLYQLPILQFCTGKRGPFSPVKRFAWPKFHAAFIFVSFCPTNI